MWGCQTKKKYLQFADLFSNSPQLPVEFYSRCVWFLLYPQCCHGCQCCQGCHCFVCHRDSAQLLPAHNVCVCVSDCVCVCVRVLYLILYSNHKRRCQSGDSNAKSCCQHKPSPSWSSRGVEERLQGGVRGIKKESIEVIVTSHALTVWQGLSC